MSRAFVSALFGIAMTVMAWYGPWEWPSWPAFAVIHVTVGSAHFADLDFARRAAFVVLLILVNVGVWAVAVYPLVALFPRALRFRRTAEH